MRWLPWALFAITGIVAAWLGAELRVSRARAEAATAAYERAAPIFQEALADAQAIVDTASQRRAAALERAVDAEVSARRDQALIDSLEEQNDELAHRLQETLSGDQRIIFDQMRSGWAVQEAAFRRQVDSLHRAMAELRNAAIQDSTALEARNRQLTVYKKRLADAEAGWQAAEHARRPGAITWVTRALALVGSVVIADRIGCALTSAERLLLPCS